MQKDIRMKQKSEHPEKKYTELNVELKQAKEHFKKLAGIVK